ncbi:hypothetical protein D9757_003934 [Collybiopsis confluens]|uniref:Uncharacterized protein n=1 Tax=Collybiopsis confluens TaxID=2823264 RepID=A0A8H5MEI4_9AGAR|nr:hypothetical protein D9757_003934 [Collybiopsis confluens]
MIPDIPPNCPPARPDLKAFRPPKSKSKIAYYGWRVRMWIEGTFGTGMLEPWEKLLLCEFLVSLEKKNYVLTYLPCSPDFFDYFVLLVTGIVRYLPHHVSVMKTRAVYYIWGSEYEDTSVFQWIGTKASGHGIQYQEL